MTPTCSPTAASPSPTRTTAGSLSSRARDRPRIRRLGCLPPRPAALFRRRQRRHADARRRLPRQRDPRSLGGLDRRERRAAVRPCRLRSAYPSDPQPLPGGRVLLADYSSPGHVVVMDRAGARALALWPAPQARGMLNHPSLAFELPTATSRSTTTTATACVIIDPPPGDRLAVRPHRCCGHRARIPQHP